MKKLLSIIFALALVVSLASCAMLPESFVETLDGLKNQIFGGEEEHVHEFVSYEKVDATCEADGYDKLKCSCGETKEEVLAGGHINVVVGQVETTCTKSGKTEYQCQRCNKYDIVKTPAYGHDYDYGVEASRLCVCRNGCGSAVLHEGNGKYSDTLVFNFSADDELAITNLYEQVLALVDGAPEYDPELHAYSEEGQLYADFKAVEALHEDLYDLVLNTITQRQLAEIFYYCDMKNKDLEDKYSYMMEYYTEMIGTFYSLSQPYYDSCYRDYYYYGMTEQEIKDFLFDSSAVSNEEYMALKDRNSAIELEFNNIADPATSSYVLVLYAEFVENNNKIANILGYDNYLEYAYESVYDRDYSYTDVAKIADYVKKYLSSEYQDLAKTFGFLMSNGGAYSDEDIDDYYGQVMDSFFETVKSNTLVNDYIDLLEFNTNPDKQISFSDAFNGLMSDGNLFRGEYEGAFVTSLYSLNLPVAYFGPGYDSPFTIVHEFGHYMNEMYNGSIEDLSQSFDLLEMHSQGNELLYLSTIKGDITETAFSLVETYKLFVTLNTIITSLSVDCFEQAVYLNSYDGTNADVIMADGKITYDEYDLLFASILQDFGATTQYDSPEYYRYVVIRSPGYYVSYAISALSVLQLYEVIETESFDVAKDAYLKLFTYTDDSLEYTTDEILVYAGLYSYNDEQLYIDLGKYLATK